MKKNNYWLKRIEEQNVILFDSTEAAINKQMAKYYLQAVKDTQEDIMALYDLLMDEIEEGKIKPNDLYKYNKYYEIQNQLNQRLLQLGHQEQKLYEKKFSAFYDDVQKMIEAINPSVFNPNFSTVGSVEQVLHSIWCADGKHWSDRIWANKALLQQRIEKGLIDCVARGCKRQDLVKQLKADFGVGFREAERITRTELAHVQIQSSADRYKAAGLDSYEIITAGDNHVCEEDAEMNGKIFKFADMKIGITAPPFHPNCRCDILPVLKEA